MSAQIGDLHFYRREELHLRCPLERARELLRRYRGDRTAIQALRELVSHRGGGAPDPAAGEEKLLEYAAHLIATGQIVVASPRRRSKTPPVLARNGAAEAPPPPPRGVPAPKIFEDLPTFTGNLHAVLQAATLLAASLTGVPFCEPCIRAPRPKAGA